MPVSQVQALALQARGAEFNAQNSQKKLLVHICNPSAETVQTDGSVGIVSWEV